MKDLLNLGQMLSVHARLSPGRMGASDLRSMSLATSNECACRLTNTLLGRSRKNFDSDHCVRTLAESHASFTSLVPTHHIMMPDDAGTAGGSSRAASSRPSHEAVPSDAKTSPAWGVRSAIAGCMG